MFLRLAIFAAVSGMSSADNFNTCEGATNKFVAVTRCNRTMIGCMQDACCVQSVDSCVSMSLCYSDSILFPVASSLSAGDP